MSSIQTGQQAPIKTDNILVEPLSALESPTQSGTKDATPAVEMPVVDTPTPVQKGGNIPLTDREGNLNLDGLQFLLDSKFSRFSQSNPEAGKLNYSTRWSLIYWATGITPSNGYDQGDTLIKRAIQGSKIDQACRAKETTTQALEHDIREFSESLPTRKIPGTNYTLLEAIRAEPIYMCDRVIQALAPAVGESSKKLYDTLRVFKEFYRGAASGFSGS